MMREECRRIAGSRFFWLLLGAAMTVNIWIIWNFWGQRAYVEVSRILAEKGLGYVTQEGKEEIIQAFEEAEKQYPGEIRVRNMVEGALDLADQFKALDLAETYIEALKLKGKAAEYARSVYATLDPVIEKNREDGTARQFFVPCGGRFFELFSRWLPEALTLETAFAAVLLMMKYVNEPFDQRTGAVIYASGTGRRINAVKGRAVLAVTAGFSAAVWGISMGMAAACFPLGRLWSTKLGSAMVLDQFWPMVTRFPVSVREYLVLQFLISLCEALLFGGLAYFAVMKTHRTFTAFGGMALACFGTAVLTQIFPKDTVWYFILRFNPVDFAGKAGRWFASGGTFLSARGYELLFILIWGAAAA